MTDPAGLDLRDLCIARNGKVLLRLNARVAPGKILAVMGPSGSGKSTLLDALVGTLAAGFSLTGAIVLDGRDITAVPTQKRRIGILYQDPLLFPHLSVGANLAFGLTPGLRGAAARRDAVAAALCEIGLEGYAERDPATLSGGQKVRVALMRTLLAEPRALLLDEPFSSLDTDLRGRMRALVFGRAHARGLPVLLVTHDGSDAEAAGGDVVRLGGPDRPTDAADA